MKPPALGQAVKRSFSANQRLRWWFAVLILIGILFIGRLFYLQVVHYNYYRQAALSDQLKEYQIAPQRGTIEAQSGGGVVPLVLNQELYTLYVDPTLVKNISSVAPKLAAITGGDASQYAKLMATQGTRYVALAQRLDSSESQKVLALQLPGIGTQGQYYRAYPDGDLASQLLGFVNNNGQGQYGIEQTLNTQLAGSPGMLKAITDVNGVPLAASKGNVEINPTPGDKVVLTVNLGMQKQLETILHNDLKNANSTSSSGSALILNANNGAVEAMANWPTYDPSQYYNVSDPSVFDNSTVSNSLEVGSTMKSLTTATALNQGAITPTSSYVDPGYVTVDGTTIKNVDPIIETPTTIKDVLRFSYNTGAIYMLRQLGGGQLDQQGRDTLYNYDVNHYQFGKLTGIEQPDESAGTVPNPDNGYALDLTYADMSFGQGLSVTMLQFASAFAAAVNGGTYYKPHLVDSIIQPNGKVQNTPTQIVKKNVVSAQTSSELRGLLEYVFTANHTVYSANVHPGYNIGGKTGTAQIPNPAGGYYSDKFNGTFIGFVGGNQPQYVIMVLVNQPTIPDIYDSAGAQSAAPIFGALADMLVDDYSIEPATTSP